MERKKVEGIGKARDQKVDIILANFDFANINLMKCGFSDGFRLKCNSQIVKISANLDSNGYLQG